MSSHTRRAGSMPSRAPINLADLPLEVLGLALRFEVDSKDGAKAMKERQVELRIVSKRWNDAVLAVDLDQAFVTDSAELTSLHKGVTATTRFQQRCSTLRRLHVHTYAAGFVTPPADVLLATIVRSCQRLVALSYQTTIKAVPIGAELQAALLARTTLRSLEFPRSKITSPQAIAMISGLPKLQRLLTADLRVEWMSGSGQPSGWLLQDFVFGGPIGVIEALGEQLGSLRLIWGGQIPWQRVAIRCPNLRSLDAFYQPDIENSVRLVPTIQHLHLRISNAPSSQSQLDDVYAALGVLLRSSAASLELSTSSIECQLGEYAIEDALESDAAGPPRVLRLVGFDFGAWKPEDRGDVQLLAAKYKVDLILDF